MSRYASVALLMICLMMIHCQAFSYPRWKDIAWKHFAWKDTKVANNCGGYPYCVGKCDSCQCTDLGRYHNTCISDARYCEAFGNPGGR